MNEFDTPFVAEPMHSQKVATDLYKRILDAGIQFQLSNASVSLRRNLFDMSEKVAPMMVPFGRNLDEDMALLAEMSTAFNELCAKVPEYEMFGLQNIPAGRSLEPLRQELSAKIAVLEALQAERNKHKAALSSALDDVRAADLHDQPADHSLISQKEKTMDRLSLAQTQLSEVDSKIKAVTFFGADTVKLLSATIK